MTVRMYKILTVMEKKYSKDYLENSLILNELKARFISNECLLDSLNEQSEHYRDFSGHQTSRTILSQSVTIQILLNEAENLKRTTSWLKGEIQSYQDRLVVIQNKIKKIKEKRDNL